VPLRIFEWVHVAIVVRYIIVVKHLSEFVRQVLHAQRLELALRGLAQLVKNVGLERRVILGLAHAFGTALLHMFLGVVLLVVVSVVGVHI